MVSILSILTLIALVHPVAPVADGLFGGGGGFGRRLQLGEGDGQLATVPANRDEDLVHALIFRRHPDDLYFFF